ncbi:MAG: DnaJ domain-containing protein, partial [Nannocystaceae bacterium]
MNDPYRTLGVPRTADEKEIKKAFRKLTQQYHPDKNPGDKAAEAKFKDVSQAYEILGDSERRANWDEFGEISLSQGFDAERARAYSQRGGFGGGRQRGGFGGGFPFSDMSNAREASFDDLLSKLFGGGTVSGGADIFGNVNERRKGRDLEGTISVSLPDSVAGITVPVRVTSANGSPRTL